MALGPREDFELAFDIVGGFALRLSGFDAEILVFGGEAIFLFAQVLQVLGFQFEFIAEVPTEAAQIEFGADEVVGGDAEKEEAEEESKGEWMFERGENVLHGGGSISQVPGSRQWEKG